jgi:alkylation response protein AidB-like acyl-CoA dehydrogenase
LDLIEVLEALAAVDSSAGWICAVGTAAPWIAARGPLELARRLELGDPRAFTALALAPTGQAVRDGDTYRLSGSWSWCSGIRHARWVVVHCLLDAPSPPNGRPPSQFFFVPVDRITILPTWDAHGLRGTGSHSIRLDDVEVPAEFGVELHAPAAKESGAICQLPFGGLGALGIAAVALGIARAALTDIETQARESHSSPTPDPIGRRATVQIGVARARARLGAARAGLQAATDAAWSRAIDGVTSTLAQRAELRLASTRAAHEAAAVVTAAYDLGGGAAVHGKSPLQRLFRDVHVLTHHAGVSTSTYERLGRVLLGAVTDDPAV